MRLSLSSSHAVALLGLALLGVGPIAMAQDPLPLITVSGVQNVPIALPTPQVLGEAAPLASPLWEVVHRDLQLAGTFEFIEKAAYIERDRGVEPGEFDFADWTVLNTVVLSKMRLNLSGDQLTADIYVYDVGSSEKLMAKRFSGSRSDLRYLGHKIADTILLATTGKKGFFGARVLAVGKRTGNKEIYIMDIDGKGVIPVTRNGSINLSPAWSPDGGAVAWTSYKRGNPDLYIKDLRSGRTRVIANRPGINSGANYSPNGKQLALSQTTSGDSDIYLIDAQTGARDERITRGGGIDVAPDFSPDGAQIAFASERSGGSNLFIYDRQSKTTKRVPHGGKSAFNFDPVFSPDGARIAFISRDRNFDLFVVNSDGTGLIRLTQDAGDNEDPSWSPDSRYLIFSSTRTGKSELWLTRADGTNQVQISRGGGWTQPSWSPE